MRPRILLRTHYQADEPRFVIACTVSCASATQSKQEDNIAACLVAWARKHGDAKLSLPGAVYAVDNAKSLELLNRSYRWTATGLAFAYLQTIDHRSSTELYVLTTPEERLYLRQYMTKSGAFVIEFGKWLLEQGKTTNGEIRDQNVIEKTLVRITEEYLKIATDVRDRAAIRQERDRFRLTDYGSATKRHKRYPLLTSLKRMHLVEEDSDGGIVPDSDGRLSALVHAIPDVLSLERLARDGSLADVLDRQIPSRPIESHPDSESLLFEGYRYAIAHGLQACPIAFVTDIFQSLGCRDPSGLLDALHRVAPSDVRFHVDRRGKRAFVLMDNLDKLRSLASGILTSGPL